MKKAVIAAVCLLALCASIILLPACTQKEPVKIVYLGDSIAEALAGSSPISEKENYGYYAILGRCNGFVYHNRSVSGHKSWQLLNIVRKEDYGANMTRTHIKDADIIHISILGNDILMSGFPEMLIQAAEDKFDKLETILPKSRENIAAIVDELKALNPDATIIFQTLYNPADQNSVLINNYPYVDEQLAAFGYGKSDYHQLTAKVIERLNNVLWDYLEEHPGAFHVADYYSAFEEVYKADRARGNRLMYPDWVHPSNEGHALAAITTQKLLEDLGYADKNFLAKYKEIRIDQLERLYADSVDVKTIKKSIKKAKSYDEVSRLYFDSTLGIIPVYGK